MTMSLLVRPTRYFMDLIYADIIIHFNCDTQYLLNYTFEAFTSAFLWAQNWGIIKGWTQKFNAYLNIKAQLETGRE